MNKIHLPCDINEIPKTIDQLKELLIKKKTDKKEMMRTLLMTEEILTQLMENSSEKITLSLKGFLGNHEIHISAKGKQFDVSRIEEKLRIKEDSYEDEEANIAIHKLMEKWFGRTFSAHYEHGINKIAIKVTTSHLHSLILTLLALAGGIIAGLVVHELLPKEVGTVATKYLFNPVYTMFMNALKMIVAPLVFCSVASSIADFSDLKALGKIAGKIILFYMCTSVLAIGVGLFTYTLFPIGDPALAKSVTDSAKAITEAGKTMDTSIEDTIINIIPNNIITPFQKSDMLQLIFLAVVLGLAAASMTRKVPQVRNAIIIANKVCTKVTTVLVSFIPLVVFCSMARMMISIDLSKLLNVVVWVPVIYVGHIFMICIYGILLLTLGPINPFQFLKKYYPVMVTAFSFASSNATLPTSLKYAEEMGISKRVYSFSLPLGATINMDGSCVALMISTLFMAKIFGVTVTGSMLMSLFFSIFILSVGAPGVPGAALICLSLLVQQIGIPAESISLVMGLYPLVGMSIVTVNVGGDAVGTIIVAKHEKLLDIDKFNS
ncbi:MAG: dicarboxylate/amino acid:cation symporter [Spirochaetia bacterium]|nr:dicarboxylate/amino acid:cation symporter [Spirochaetales bacterium]MBR5915482.1 dicarboxylate/amino acid:cation symporter [Spirochaetia bacterium]